MSTTSLPRPTRKRTCSPDSAEIRSWWRCGRRDPIRSAADTLRRKYPVPPMIRDDARIIIGAAPRIALGAAPRDRSEPPGTVWIITFAGSDDRSNHVRTEELPGTSTVTPTVPPGGKLGFGTSRLEQMPNRSQRCGIDS